ncbi:MAG: hypothetical protein DWP97_10305 [Calditrichaeota bacterium]|nr:MAG: hypothetical protein DWP97_10305 [Calditrichota bacterium]
MALEPGRLLGPYEILEQAGAGGMGEVYKARDSRLDRIVAIKVLPATFALNDDIKQRFEREAKTISSLNHPNICTLYDVGTQDGLQYLVMEFIEGETLADKIKRGPIPMKEFLEISIQVADALDKAHRQGLIHRDLKPGNIMLTKSGAKLLDFGLAKIQMENSAPGVQSITQTTPLTGIGTLLGTMQYMAPEQLEGAEADTRSDIFAFGATMYEMATGAKAFGGGSQASLIASILREEPRSVSEISPQLPPILEQTISQCIAKDPEQRWQSVADLKRSLQWIADGKVGSHSHGLIPQNRSTRETIIMIGMICFIIATAVLSYMYVNQPEEEKIVSRFTVEIEQGLTGIRWPRISPNGKLIALKATDSTGTRRIWVRSLNSLEAYPLFGTENADRHYWSPDSKFLTYFDDNKLMKIPVSGGQSVLLSEGVNGSDCSWGSSDIILFDGATGDPLRMVSANGGQINTTAEVDTASGENFIGWPWFLPNGENFIFIANSIDSTNKIVSTLKVGALNSPESKSLYTLKSEVRLEYCSKGFILFVQDNNLMALPFDDKKLEVTGEAKPIAQQIALFQNADSYSISDNGTLLYHSSSTNATSQFEWVDRTGKEISKIGAVGNYYDGDLSPDESKIVYALQEDGNNSNIWVYDLKRNIPTKLTFDKNDETWPIWSSDGQSIAYASNKSGTYDVFLKNINGLEEPVLLYSNDSSNVGPGCFSKDGKKLLFVSLRGSRDIGILHIDDSNRVDMFANTSFSEQMPRLSPNDKYVAYLSNESGQIELYVRQLEAGGGKWQLSSNGAVFPRWSADGKELFYHNFDRQIVSIPVETEGTFKAGNPVILFNTTLQSRLGYQIGPYDVSNDGQRFLLNSSLSGTSTRRMIVVLNITEEI